MPAVTISAVAAYIILSPLGLIAARRESRVWKTTEGGAISGALSMGRLQHSRREQPQGNNLSPRSIKAYAVLKVGYGQSLLTIIWMLVVMQLLSWSLQGLGIHFSLRCLQ